MKRIHYVFFIVLVMLLLSACSAADNDTQKEPLNVIGDSNVESKSQPEESSAAIDEPQQTEREDSAGSETSRILIAYRDYRPQRCGNRKMAEWLEDSRLIRLYLAGRQFYIARLVDLKTHRKINSMCRIPGLVFPFQGYGTVYMIGGNDNENYNWQCLRQQTYLCYYRLSLYALPPLFHCKNNWPHGFS